MAQLPPNDDDWDQSFERGSEYGLGGMRDDAPAEAPATAELRA